jgi:hypothetical protein
MLFRPALLELRLEVTEKLEDKRLTPPIAINTYRQTMNPVRFIGKKYASGGEAWDNFDWAEGWDSCNSVADNCFFKRLKIDCTKVYADGNPQDGSALIGLMYHNDNIRQENEPYHFEYWIGFFTPENTPVGFTEKKMMLWRVSLWLLKN